MNENFRLEIEKIGIKTYSNNLIILNEKSISLIDKIIKAFELYRIDFSFYDNKYPKISDPGAYFSHHFSYEEKKWKMTLGNHGWTGGIYTINSDILILQIKNLTISNKNFELELQNVGFFSNYKEESFIKNEHMNNELNEIHR